VAVGAGGAAGSAALCAVGVRVRKRITTSRAAVVAEMAATTAKREIG
jgi:hypothetical protein